MSCQVNWIAGVSAIGFAALIVIGNLILVPAGFPAPVADIDRVTGFFAGGRVPLGIATALVPAAWVLAAVFGAAAVVVVQRRAPDEAAVWALAGFAGLLLQNATFTGVVALRLALGKTRGEAANTLWPLHDAVFTLNGTFLALALVGLTLAGRGAELVNPWLAVIGLTAAALQFASATLAPLVIERGGPFGWIGLTGWVFWVVWLVWYGVAFLADGSC